METLHPTLVASHLNAYLNQDEVTDLVDINDVELSYRFKDTKVAPAIAVILASKFYESTAKDKPADFRDKLTAWSKSAAYWTSWDMWSEEEKRGILVAYTRYSETRFKIREVDGEYEIKAYLALTGSSDELDRKDKTFNQTSFEEAMKTYREYKAKYRKGVPTAMLLEATSELFKAGIAKYYNSLGKKSTGYLGVCYDVDKSFNYLHNKLVTVTDELGAYNGRASNGVLGSEVLNYLKTNEEFVTTIDSRYATTVKDRETYLVQLKKLGVTLKMEIKKNQKTKSMSFYLMDMLFR